MKYKTMMIMLMAPLMWAGVAAQKTTLEIAPSGKELARSFDVQFVGTHGDEVYLVEPLGRLDHQLSLVRMNMQQQVLAQVQLNSDKDFGCYGGFVNGQHVDLLECTWKDNGLRVYRDRRDRETLAPVGEPAVLADYRGTEGDRMGLGMVTSADEQLIACIYGVGRETQSAEVQVGLYNHELEEYWKVDTRMRGFDMYYLSDSGEVVLGGRSPKGFRFAVVDGERETSFEFDLDISPTTERKIVRYGNGRLLMCLLHPAEKYSKRPEPFVDCIYLVSYDLATRRVDTVCHTIGQVESNRLYNVDDAYHAKRKDYAVEFLNLLQSHSDGEGGYVVLDQMWTTTVDGVPSVYHRLGMLVMRFDREGRIAWRKTLRLSEYCDYGRRRTLAHRWVPTDGGMMLAWMSHKSTIKQKEEKAVKDFEALAQSGMLSVVTIDAAGNQRRDDFEVPSKHALLGAPHRIEGDRFMVLLRGITKGEFGKLEIR